MLHLDFETRSLVELGGKNSVGLYNYATDPSTEWLMLAWAIGEGEVNLWFPSEPIPKQLKEALEDSRVEISAFNSAFERYILQHKLGITIPASRFQDPQASSRYLSLPANLEEVGEILGLPVELRKDKKGEDLINVFCKLSKRKKKRGEEAEFYFRDKITDPELWVDFCNYCKQDVVAEREIIRRQKLLKVFPLPSLERKIWIADQVINDRGIPVDVDFVKKAYALAVEHKRRVKQKQNELTGLENANSNTQLLEWVQGQGFEGNSLRKEAVGIAVKDETNQLTPLGRQVLAARKEASSTSYQKLAAILRQVNADGRLRNQFIYMGSSRCGRWSGNAVQLHNMARPEKQFKDKGALEEARQLIYNEDYDGIVKRFGSVLLTVKSCIRTCFVAPPGKDIVVSDFNAVETRVGAWMCNCEPMLEVFRQNKDPYIDFAVKMTQIPYDKIARDRKSEDPKLAAAADDLRQLAKPGVLQCVYRAGGGDWKINKYGDRVKGGLWGYAANMGIDAPRDKWHEIVKVFRNSYKEFVQAWYDYEEAVADVLKEGTTRVVRVAGPQGCIVFDKITIQGRHPILRIKLPSSRFLHYVDARIKLVKMPWEDRDGGEVYRDTLVYAGVNQDTKQWEDNITSHGGKIFENIDQGISRDLLAVAILETEAIGLPVVGHAHDEIIGEREKSPLFPGIYDLEHIMNKVPNWCPGLLIGSDGFESPFYKKN